MISVRQHESGSSVQWCYCTLSANLQAEVLKSRHLRAVHQDDQVAVHQVTAVGAPQAAPGILCSNHVLQPARAGAAKQVPGAGLLVLSRQMVLSRQLLVLCLWLLVLCLWLLTAVPLAVAGAAPPVPLVAVGAQDGSPLSVLHWSWMVQFLRLLAACIK